MNNQLSKHIRRGDIKINKKNQSGGDKPKLSPMSQNYRLYLQSGKNKTKSDKPKPDNSEITKNKNEEKKITIKRNSPKKISDTTIKIIHHKENKSKHKFTRKRPSKIKDINEIESEMENMKNKKETIKQSIVKDIQHNIAKKIHKTPDSIRKNKRNSKRNNKRNSKNKKNTKGSRKISMKKHNKLSEKDIMKVQKHIEEIRSKKTTEIKSELEKEGIKVSGKSKRLLKDIYLYSKMCGINIKHEK